jgi:ribosomal protein L40E
MATVYCNTMWWPPTESLGGLVNMIFFLGFSILTTFHFLCAMCDGPGYLPLGWKPTEIETKEEMDKQLQWCETCQGYKAPRAHHCRKCGRCVMKMDHHCPWINNCVGHFNHGHFTAFLASAVCGCSLASVTLGMSLYYGLNRSWYHYYGTGTEPLVIFSVWTLLATLFGLGLAIGVVVAVGLLLFFQLRAIAKNQTGIEDWILEKAKYRRKDTGEEFIYPYNLGRKRNFSEVLNWSCWPKCDGITWPLVDGTDQFTLTREQISQKAEKRLRTREYEIIIGYSGSWLPITQGFSTCCHPPCTDEPRIGLDPGDRVQVTRWKKHWLYGDKISKIKQPDEHPARVRGWFPRRCAVETMYHDSDCHAKRRETKKKK